ncbi:MAG: hypothetical protein AAGA68_22585 [Pseudomonadota bacterium]
MSLLKKKREPLDVDQALVGKGHRALEFPSVLKPNTNLKAGPVPLLDPEAFADKKAKAKVLVANFVAKFQDKEKKLTGGWDFSIAEFETSILELITSSDQEKDLIQQGAHNLCGPAAFLFFFIRREVDQFSRYAISLFETHAAMIGRNRVKASRSLVERKYDANWGIETHRGKRRNNQVDWMCLSAIRDHFNLFGYRGVETRDAIVLWRPVVEASGITTPSEIEHWMKEWGLYTTVINDTNAIQTKGVEHLLACEAGSERDVCCLIEGSIMGADVGKFGDLLPNHWINLLEVKKENESSTRLRYGTWGAIEERVFSNEDLSRAYYGYVAGVL